MSVVDEKELTLRGRLRLFSENTSLHGLRIVGDSNASTLRRFIWGMAVASFLVLVIMQGVHLVQLTLKPSIQTFTEINKGDVPIRLPAITICNNNNQRKTVASDFGELHKNGTMNQTDFYQKTAHQIEEMVILCGHSLEVDKNCTGKFKQVFTDMGVCYTFNSDPEDPVSVPISGSSTAWFFLLNVQEYEYKFTKLAFGGVGFKMLIHRQKEFLAVQDIGVSFAPGEKTLAALSRRKVIMDVRMDCYNTKDHSFVNPLLYYKFYTRETCHHECFTRYLEKRCGCREFFANGVERLCEDQDNPCVRSTFVRFDLDPLGMSNCYCPPECDITEYDMKLSHSRYPASSAMEYLNNVTHIPVTVQRDNLALLMVYFETSRVMITKQSFSYDISKLGGDLGGYMGLMLGASFLTLMEVADLMVICVHQIIISAANNRTRA